MARLRATKLSAIGSGRRRKLSAIAKQFADGTDGMWFQPSDLATMFQDSAGASPVTAMDQPLGRMSDKSGRGNHATQGTPTARGKISAKYNILERTQDIANAYWAKYGLVITGGAVVAPDGTMTGDKIAADATNVQHRFIKNLQAQSGDTIKVRGRFQKAEVSVVVFEYLATQFFCEINLNTGTITSSGGGGVNITSTSYSIEDLGGGWFEVVMNGTLTSFVNALLTVYPETKAAKVGDGISGFYVGGFDFRVAGRDLPYQRVDAVAVYATAGFPVYGSTDGADDFYTTAGGGGSTTGFFFCAAVSVNALLTSVIWSDAGLNAGFELGVLPNGQVRNSAGTGSGRVASTAPIGTIVTSTKVLITCFYDGTNVGVQVNAAPEWIAACPVVAAGTTYSTAFRSNGGSGAFANGNLYEMVVLKNKSPSAQDRADIQREMAARHGIVL